jgi:uncharacterized membrane protein YfcA
MTALIGSFSHIRMGNIDPKTAVVFGIPSILGVFATRAWLVPAIPQILFTCRYHAGGFLVDDTQNKVEARGRGRRGDFL